MKKARFIALLLCLICILTLFFACATNQTNNSSESNIGNLVNDDTSSGDSATASAASDTSAAVYSIGVPKERLTAVVGSFELPTYYVTDGNVWLKDYKVIASDVIDPDGAPVYIDEENTFSAYATGVYSATYTAVYVGGKEEILVPDAVVEIEFIKPASVVVADFNNGADHIRGFGCTPKFCRDEIMLDGANGALKMVAKQAYTDTYVAIDMPNITDISAYDYIQFSVYNTCSETVQVGFAHACFTLCQPREWTTIKLKLSDVGVKKHDTGAVWSFQKFDKNWNGINVDFTDITSFAIRVRGGMPTDGALYVSSILATVE